MSHIAPECQQQHATIRRRDAHHLTKVLCGVSAERQSVKRKQSVCAERAIVRGGSKWAEHVRFAGGLMVFSGYVEGAAAASTCKAIPLPQKWCLLTGTTVRVRNKADATLPSVPPPVLVALCPPH